MYETKPYFYGTGRRKDSVARVRVYTGTGKITINDRDIDNYFGLETLKLIVRSPLVLLGITGGLFLIRLAQLPGLVLVLLRDLLCLAASCRRQGFYLPLCIRLDALGDPFQSLHGLLRFTECW